jgi:branched-subunit amino acid aminotransferase/4-amino-4-deoxychorismate lyase
MSRQVLSEEEVIHKLREGSPRPRASIGACYLSWLDGIVTDSKWMLIGLDDHIVHRGDGVFEAIKFIRRKPYLLDSHLERMKNSAEKISLKFSNYINELPNLIQQVIEVSRLENGLIRIFLSRGTGSFSTNPYDPEGTELAVVAMALTPPKAELFELGASVGLSRVQPKDSFWSQIKSCNYLPNVMMKKEAVDRKLDFVVAMTEAGGLTESSTENIILVDSHGLLCRPHQDRILRGCTMIRTFELARKFHITETFERFLTVKDIKEAREVMMVGTTLDVLPITQFEGQKIADGRVGPVARRLLELLRQDQF